MLFTATFRLPGWDETTKQRIATFWTEQGFHLTESAGDTLVGRRGSLLGNLTYFDMARLCSSLTVSVSEAADCTCTIDVNTCFQIITKWNKEHWTLELATFESYILSNDRRTEDWKEYRRKASQLDRKWVLLGVLGALIAIVMVDGGLATLASLLSRHAK